jgi:PleD family two-component response regulator
MDMSEQDSQVLEDILIVDDSPNTLRLLSQMLSEQGYKVRAVTNGPRALASAQTIPPDLILLDIKMPDMNGYEVCQHLKADARTYDIPIIFISALDETEDKVEAFAVGGVDYITKPLQYEEVVARVETHLSLRHLQKHLEKLVRDQVRKLELTDTARLTALSKTTDEMAQKLNQLLTTIASDTNDLRAIIQQSGEKVTEKMDELSQIGENLEKNAAQCRQIVDRLISLGNDPGVIR